MNMHKVIWQEGMLLRPQHFQQNDRYYDNQLKSRTQLATLYSWGFLNLELDEQHLGMGKLVVSQASGILPDGTLFDLKGRVKPLAVDVPINTVQEPVYLALPLVTGNHLEARLPAQTDVLARYTAYPLEVSDSNAGEDSISPVSCGLADFRLIIGDQQGDQSYVKLKIAVVSEATSDKRVKLDASFIPSFIHTHASPYLLSCLTEVLSLLDNRGDILAERIKTVGKVGGAEIGDFLMLQLINRSGLLLRHYSEIEHLHPVELYRALLGLLGDLSTFASKTKRPSHDSRYSHGDQGETFRKLMGEIRQALSMVLEQHAIELVLEERSYGVQVSPLTDHQLLGKATFVLAAKASCDIEELRRLLPSQLKVGPVEHIRQLVNLNLPGVKIRPLPVAPRQIPFHADRSYFALDMSAEDITQLGRSGGIAFHVSGEFVDLEFKFWAIRNPSQ